MITLYLCYNWTNGCDRELVDDQARCWQHLIAGLSEGKIQPGIGDHKVTPDDHLVATSDGLAAELSALQPAGVLADRALVIADGDVDGGGSNWPAPQSVICGTAAGGRTSLFVGTRTRGPWWILDGNLPEVLKAAFLLELGVPPTCPDSGCVAHPSKRGREWPPPKIRLCQTCRTGHPEETIKLLEGLANWLNRNRAEHVTLKNLATVSKRRLPLLHETPGHPLELVCCT